MGQGGQLFLRSRKRRLCGSYCPREDAVKGATPQVGEKAEFGRESPRRRTWEMQFKISLAHGRQKKGRKLAEGGGGEPTRVAAV